MEQSNIGDVFLIIFVITICFVFINGEMVSYKVNKLWKAIRNILKDQSRLWKATEKNSKEIEEIKKKEEK